MVSGGETLADARGIYLFVIGAVALTRSWELRLSRRHARKLLARGGVEAGQRHLPWMILLHAAFLLACPAEVLLLHRPLIPALAAPAFLAFLAAQALRYWAIATLGERWTIRVIALPGAPPVLRGPYRWIRHPNYSGVVVEFLAIPLIHTAWLTALVGSLLNGVLLTARIRAEETLLREVGGVGADLFSRPRFVPRV
jgi:methyltransferase